VYPNHAALDVFDETDHRGKVRPRFTVPAARRPAQRCRRVDGDAAAGEIGRHGASARIVSGIPDPPGHCNPAGGIVGSNGAGRDGCRPMICRSEEQPPAAQFGEYVARVAPAAPAPYKYPAIAAVSDDEAHAIMDWAAASPTTPFAPSAAERRSGVSILRLKMGSGMISELASLGTVEIDVDETVRPAA